MRWVDRTGLAKAVTAGSGLVFSGAPAEYGLSLPPAEIEAMQALSRRSLETAGLGRSDRVLLALRQEGSPAVGLLAQAASSLTKSVATTGPGGRLRLLTTIRALKPTTLVITPCGAADFLARLYLEFNVDPVELDIQRIILVGEIASPGLRKRLGKEFEAEIGELYCDPVFGAALAARAGSGWEAADEAALGFAGLTEDELTAGVDGKGELVLRPVWAPSLADLVIRTGQVIAGQVTGGKPGDAGLFDRTVGQHVLARGQFVSLPLLRRQLALIDGASRWSLTIDRGDRTLDSLTLTVGLARETLVANPMWKGRIQQAVAAVTPIRIAVDTVFADPAGDEPREAVNDLRGHHLGTDRAKVSL
jgi:phenylacetate-CoA ligase